MNARGYGGLLGAIAVLAIPPRLPAGEAPDRCITIEGDAQRLACYDAAFGRLAGKAQAPGRHPETPPPPPAVPGPAPPVQEQYGFANAQVERSAVQDREEARQSSSSTSEVVAVDEGSNGRFIATLANGQVWAQSERDSSAIVRKGDTVTVRRASLGSYLLITRGGIATRVRRLE